MQHKSMRFGTYLLSSVYVNSYLLRVQCAAFYVLCGVMLCREYMSVGQMDNLIMSLQDGFYTLLSHLCWWNECIDGNELYEKRKQEKIRICAENNIPLIQLYQSDIYSKTNKEIYDTLLNYISNLKEAAQLYSYLASFYY